MSRLTSASLRPARAGTRKEWSASWMSRNDARSPSRSINGESSPSSASLSRRPLQKQHRDLDREKMLATLVRRPSRRMQGKAEEGEAADARQGRCGLRLRGHAAAEGLAAGDQRKCRCKLRGCGHGSPNGRMRKFGRVGPPSALFHVRKLITQRGDAALTKLPRDDIHERVEHSGSRPMREDVAGASACWRQ